MLSRLPTQDPGTSRRRLSHDDAPGAATNHQSEDAVGHQRRGTAAVAACEGGRPSRVSLRGSSGNAGCSRQRAGDCVLTANESGVPDDDRDEMLSPADGTGEQWVQVEGRFEPLPDVILFQREGLGRKAVRVFAGADGAELMCVDDLVLASGQSCAAKVKSLLGKDLYRAKGRDLEGKVLCAVLVGPPRRVDVAPLAICLRLFKYYLLRMQDGVKRDGMVALVAELRRMGGKEVGTAAG